MSGSKRQTGLKDEQIAYVGDDIMDLPYCKRWDWRYAVRDGWPGLKPRVNYVTED